MNMKTRWIIGTRGSRLALKQTDMVIKELKNHYPGFQFLIKTIKTTGDTQWDKPLQTIGEKGLFVKEIEEELVRGGIDMAIHSMKDLPSELAEGLVIGAMLKREDPRDAFISFTHDGFSEIREGSRIGTNSVRRKSQILHLNKGIVIVPIRGNVDTRIDKIRTLALDGIILALAGVKRMGFEEHVKEVFPLGMMVPPSGQGAIGIETRNEKDVLGLLVPIHDTRAFLEVSIERRFQSLIGGGCSVPLGVNAAIIDDMATIHAAYGDEMGLSMVKAKETDKVKNAENLILRILSQMHLPCNGIPAC
ncbi:MAG: hydroxymethylbilane synthase [Syntrophus sp. (in: bacteria)]|nr:hydroxymethylbilane synthase [Syntrophus sp. (in: bacteria)]